MHPGATGFGGGSFAQPAARARSTATRMPAARAARPVRHDEAHPALLVRRVHIRVADVGGERDRVALAELVALRAELEDEAALRDVQVLARAGRVRLGVLPRARREEQLVELEAASVVR